MRVIKGLLVMLVAAVFGGLLFGNGVMDIVLVFTDFSVPTLLWTWAVCGALSGALAGYLFFTEKGK